MYQEAKAKGDKSPSVEAWVEKEMSGGALVDGGILSKARDLFSPVRRSILARAIQTLPVGLVQTLAEGELKGKGTNAERVQAVIGSGLLGGIETAVQKGEEAQKNERRRLLEAKVRQEGYQPTAEEVAAVAPEKRGSLLQRFGSDIKDVGAAIKADPGRFITNLAIGLTDPANVAAEAASAGILGGAAAAARTGAAAARATRAGRLIGENPLVRTGAVSASKIPGAVKQVAEEVTQGALSEGLVSGQVTPEGVAQELPLAVAGTVARKSMLRKTQKAEGAAPRPVLEQPASSLPPEPAPVPAPEPEPSPVPEVPAAPEPAPIPEVAPEPVAPAPEAQVEAPAPAPEPLPSATKKAEEKIDPKTKAKQLVESQSQMRAAQSAAKRYAKAGNLDFAKQVLEEARPAFEAMYPGRADKFMEAELQILEAESKKRRSILPQPKSEQEAQAQVEQAVAEGTPEAIEAARPAVEMLNPVGDDANRVVEQMKAQPKPAPAPQPKPSAPEPGERPRIMVGDKEQELPGHADWASDPVTATSDAVMVLSSAKAPEMVRRESPAAADAVAKALDQIDMRLSEPVQTGAGPLPLRDFIEELQIAMDGEDIGASLLDPNTTVFDDFLDDFQMTREDLKDAWSKAQATPEERAAMTRAASVLAVTKTPLVERAAPAEAIGTVILNSGLNPDAVAGHVRAVGEFAKNYLERGGDEMTRFAETARLKGDTQAADAADFINKEARRLREKADVIIGRAITKLSDAVRTTPDPFVNLRYLHEITDALEGKLDPKTLEPWQQNIHDTIREILDESGKMYQEVTGNPMRSDYFPRVEEKARINDEVKSVREQLGDTAKKLEREQVTAADAKALPKVESKAVDGIASELGRMFQSKGGKIVATLDDRGVPLYKTEAAYLDMLPEDGDAPVFMPEIFRKKKITTPVTGPDGKVTDQITYEIELRPDAEMTPEDLAALLRGEAVRLMVNRADYDPDEPSGPSGRRFASWQADGSILHRRIMPYMGDEFYDRNPLNVVEHVLPRQVRGLMRQQVWGKKKEVLLQKLSEMRNSFSDKELGLTTNEDGTVRLTDSKDKSFYSNSLLRTIEDAAMGYMRPFDTGENWLQEKTRMAGSIARFWLLTGRIATAAKNEIMGAAGTAMISPRASIAYGAARGRVFGMQMESGARGVAEKLVKSSSILNKPVGSVSKGASSLLQKAQGQALKALVEGDPMRATDLAAMSDVSLIGGATRGDRLFNQMQYALGSFGNSSRGMDVAGHFAGHQMFLSLVHDMVQNPKAFAKEKGILEEDLTTTTGKKELDRAAQLLDSNGFPRDKAAADELMLLSRPFVAEFKSKLTSLNHSLFQPKALRNRWAKSLAWMSVVPISIASAHISAIRRYGVKGNLSLGEAWRNLKSGQYRSALSSAGKAAGDYSTAGYRGSKLVVGSMAGGGLAAIAKANPAVASILTAGLVGSYPAILIAGAMGGGDYNPDDERGKAELDVLAAELQSGDETVKALAKMAAVGFPFTPRGLSPDMLSEEQMRLLGQRNPEGSTVSSTFLPGAAAFEQGLRRRRTAIDMAYGEAKAGRAGNALRLGTSAVFTPSGLDAMGEELFRFREAQKIEGAPDQAEAKAGAMSLPGSPQVMMRGIENQIERFKKRKE